MVNLSAPRIGFSASNDNPSETTIVRLRQPRVDCFVTAFVPLPAIGWPAVPKLSESESAGWPAEP